MSLANRLAQLDRELDAFQKPVEVLEEVLTRSLIGHFSDLKRVDRELNALAADVSSLAATLEAARPASSPTPAATDAVGKDKGPKQSTADVAARTARTGVRPAEKLPAPAAPRPPGSPGKTNAAEPPAPTSAAEVILPPTTSTALDQTSVSAPPSQPDEPATATGETPAAEPAAEQTEAFGAELFGDLDAGAFDAPQDRLDDVVSSDDHGAQLSAFVDLASVLEQDEARVAASPKPIRGESESTDLLNALVAQASEEPAQPLPETRPRSMPPPLRPSKSLSPPALATAAVDREPEPFESLTDEMDMMDVDDFEVVTENGSDEGAEVTLSEVGLSEVTTSAATDPTPADQQPGDPEKKGSLFKKLFR